MLVDKERMIQLQEQNQLSQIIKTNEVSERLSFALDKLIQNHYEGNRELGDYLSSAIDNIACFTQSLHATDY